MKRIITILLVGLLVVSCKTDSKPAEKQLDGYVISGNAPGIYNGIRVYLQSKGLRGKVVNRDTAIVMNEQFKFEGKIAYPEVLTLAVNSVKGNLPIIVENKAITIQLDKDDLKKSVISGTKANEDMVAFEAQLHDLVAKRVEQRGKMRQLSSAEERAQVSAELADINKQLTDLPINYVEKNPNSLYAMILFDNMLGMKDVDIKRIAPLYDSMDDNNKNSKLGTDIKKKIDIITTQRAARGATEIGKKAPEFSAPTSDGKQLALADALGKVTIIDFWAAWCGPCRRENPNVVNIYNKYHDKGLEIIGVSLDGNPRQKDPKSAWLKAIEQDKLTWNHVSNLNYFNDPVARAYNINSIPATFILDEKGTIIAKNLRGADLEAKIAELLN